METGSVRRRVALENDKAYRILFYVGGGCNIVTATLVFLLIHRLPGMLGIEPPRYSVFIYLNLMTLVIFGCMQWTVARRLREERSLVKLLIAAKFSMAIVFLYVQIADAPVKELSVFLAPMVIFDFLMGLLFWRFLVYSRSPG